MSLTDKDSANNCICLNNEVEKKRATVSGYILEDQMRITVVRWLVVAKKCCVPYLSCDYDNVTGKAQTQKKGELS
ncbi:hypothetical protein T05_14551 [Trichinella murrelli]|uniref:Uncharacterized protein n=1 Tax=Trichinella murrelli TaxID=144512 RepID=A0A0V0T981_9BILA|nr:hypothetical protein T05_6874 [Trichinella murrelli]KRX37299.1 hypothetical protein T05_14551 [Trichinella murrelli]